jgi:predicted lipid carrier protein YhbT
MPLERHVFELPFTPPKPDLKSIYPDIPRLLTLPLAKLPFLFQKKGLISLLQRVMKEALDEGECDFLKNRWLAVKINDLGIEWFLVIPKIRKFWSQIVPTAMSRLAEI